MTEPNHGPCWLYHSEQGAKIFTTQAELDEAIAQDWADSPAAARGQGFTDPEPGPDDGVIAEEAIEKVQVVVSKKHKRRS